MAPSVLKQFGEKKPGLDYLPRTGAYGILERDGRIACARIGYSDFTYDLPGGAVDPGETPEQAVVREYREETGIDARVVRPVTDLLHYFIHDDGTPYNNHCYFYAMAWRGENPSAKVEPDHELVWLNPLQVFTNLKNEGYAWAFLLWLRAHSQNRGAEPVLPLLG